MVGSNKWEKEKKNQLWTVLLSGELLERDKEWEIKFKLINTSLSLQDHRAKS